jgi:hypothetical protein
MEVDLGGDHSSRPLLACSLFDVGAGTNVTTPRTLHCRSLPSNVDDNVSGWLLSTSVSIANARVAFVLWAIATASTLHFLQHLASRFLLAAFPKHFVLISLLKGQVSSHHILPFKQSN